jgi:hypothetical protein
MLNLEADTKLVGTGIEVKLVGQKGIGIFASKAMYARAHVPPLYEEGAVVMIKKLAPDVTAQDLRQASERLSASQQRAFKHLPTMLPIDRSSRLAIFRATVFTPLPTLSSCYNIYSLMNPSCRPNLRLMLNPMNNFDFAVFLSKDVKPGEELTYTETHSICCMTTAERQEYFADPYSPNPYRCHCELCSAPISVRQMSDRRRRLMRQLLYLITGRDLSDVRSTIRGLKGDKTGSELRKMHEYMFDQLAEAEGVTWMTPHLR